MGGLPYYLDTPFSPSPRSVSPYHFEDMNTIAGLPFSQEYPIISLENQEISLKSEQEDVSSEQALVDSSLAIND